ncbi:MAG: Putative phosphatase [uncultured Solirubrobacteraceae bacterium]|uniref:Phosphatase n=1 Tax=uncultured Solirubrobacteraceae bacterium TaxID=1162706 RepID=A0A6J4RRM6_9ACTN|nr:MAG: Putative phosphatase [uncultured Solirubrobacteraceae bacterium]
MIIDLPDPSLVVLIGVSGSGKSTWAARHFAPTEVLSSDFCRALVADDENDQAATPDAFAVLHYIAGRRLGAGRLTVVDATSVQREARRPLVALAREHDLFPVAVVLDLPEGVCQERNRLRPNRDFGPHVVKHQRSQLRRSLKGLQREGFRRVWILRTPEEVEAAEVTRAPLWSDRRQERGPFDIIGDVHGCYDELVALLERLGYAVAHGHGQAVTVTPPPGRRAVFVGDYVDRGPDTPGVLRLVMGMVHAGTAICVPGNHDIKLVRKLNGRDVQLTHGLAETLDQLAGEPEGFGEQARAFLEGLVSHAVLDGGDLVVAHAGMKESYQGRSSGRVRDFALFGETTGETDEVGLPVRGQWAADYRGRACVVYGHTPVADPEWLNNTINIDTGCVFGGRLTALRWPERRLVSVPARRTYYAPVKPFLAPDDAAPGTEEQRPAFVLDIDDVAGKRIVQTRLTRTVTVHEEHAAAALEVMGRFAIDPRWLVYLPPAMSPTATSRRAEVLEHPQEAFAEYRSGGVPVVSCQEKHMGSRAIAVVCRTAAAARERFGVDGGETGALYTRTGRPFLDDPAETEAVLARIRAAAETAGLWDELGSEWVVLDCELLPWSAKAMGLIRGQYAAVGAGARAGLHAAVGTLEQAAGRGLDVGGLLDRQRGRIDHVDRYTEAYRRYVWPVDGVAGLRLAPFHVLAAETGVFVARDHGWHLDRCDALVAADPDWLQRTDRRVVDVTDPAAQEEAVAWWQAMTDAGGEGMVVKPMSFVARGHGGLVQPGVKCRGREYLRIVYGPEYADPSQIGRLRGRSLGRKRSLAVREFGLGVEALERFVRREPLHRVHECVFAVLALESEPVDPRL